VQLDLEEFREIALLGFLKVVARIAEPEKGRNLVSCVEGSKEVKVHSHLVLGTLMFSPLTPC
jgi:hypothetical protein